MKRILYLIPIILLSGCFVQKETIIEAPAPEVRVQQVKPFATRGESGGVYYALPRSIVNIDVEVSRRDYTKGPYAQFASKYIGLSVPQSNSSVFEIKSLKVSTSTEPDPEQYYFVEIPKGNDIILELSESGLIMGFNSSTGNVINQSGALKLNRQETPAGGDTGLTPEFNLLERVDTLVEFAGSDSLQSPRILVRRTMVEKSLEQRAKEAADEIVKLQESKMSLITGFAEVNYSYETMRFMYEQLDRMELELTQMFTGYYSSSSKQYHFSYTPGSETFEMSKPLFRFSPQQGILPLDQNLGTIAYLNVSRSNNNLLISEFEASGTLNKGLVYRLPDFGNISLVLGTTSMLETKILINQFGTIARLSPGSNPVLMHPGTGGIRSMGKRE